MRPIARLALLVVAASAPLARAEVTGFVRADGDRFVVDGKPFAFVGANLAVLQGDSFRARFRATLAACAADGLTVGRVWAFAEGPADSSDWHRREVLFRAGPDGFIEAGYRQLDRVLAEADALGLRLIITLSNNWSDYGGIPMYLKWAGLPPGRGPNDPARELFYSDERVRAWFREGLARLLDRTNTVSGRRYVEDPAIFSWELMNESSVPTPAGAEARRAWIVEMARFIKARDPNHLVGAGVVGYGSRDERAEWIRVNRLPEIDYADTHLYPDATDSVAPPGGHGHDGPVARALRRLYDLLDDRAQLARFVIHKPLVVGEFGFRTDGVHRRGRAPEPARRESVLGGPRARWFRRFVERLFFDGGAGALAWIYQPWTGRARDFGIYVDRPDTDDVRSTLRVLSARAAAGPPPAGNARLGPALGERFLYEPLVTVRGDARPHHRWRPLDGAVGGGSRGRQLFIAPERFADARFERVGITDTETPLVHAWGAGWGRFRYRFLAPPGPLPRRLVVSARLSSEWPGRSAPRDGGSRVRLLLDGVAVGEREVVPDDGIGARVEFTVEDPALLRRLARPGAHLLAFEVPDEPGAHGLCIYGAPTGEEPAPPAPPVSNDAAPIRLAWERGVAPAPAAASRDSD